MERRLIGDRQCLTFLCEVEQHAIEFQILANSATNFELVVANPRLGKEIDAPVGSVVLNLRAKWRRNVIDRS
jgi:hypothetical protein